VLNGKELAVGDLRTGWLEFVLQDSLLSQGANVLELSCHQQGVKALSLLDLYVAITPD